MRHRRPASSAPLLGVLALLLLAPAALAQDATPPPPPPPPTPTPQAPLTPEEARERAARTVEDVPDIVVRDVPLRFEGPLTEVVRTSPLGFATGPVVPLDAGGSRDVLSPRRVRDLTPTTVEEVINHLPGVSSRLYSGDEYVRPSISVRGMPDNGFTEYTAVLVDGFNMSTLAYGWTAISIFPFTPERIWAAEVYRGAHALRYGPNTIGGVVNLVTQPIPIDPVFRERVVFGSNDYIASVTDAGGTTKDGHWGALVTYVQKAGDTFRDDNEFDLNEFSLKTLWRPTDRTWLEVDGAHWRAVHQLPGRLTKAQLDDDPTQNPNPHEVDWHGWAYWGTATLHHDYGCGNWVEMFLYHRKAQRALDSPRPASPPYNAIRSADSDNYNSGVELRGEFSAYLGTEHRIHWGARYHREQIDRTTFEDPMGGGPRTVTQDARTITHALAANVDDTVRCGRLTVNVGVRGEWIVDSFAEDEITGGKKSFDFSDLFPGASVSWELTPCWALFANAHASFRAPQTFSYDFAKPDQDLDFEHGTNLEVGTRVVALRGISGSLAVWQTDFSDFIEYDPDLDVVTNYGGFRSRGVDLVIDADLGCWSRRLRGWSVYGNATRQESEIQEGANEGNATPFVPEWLAVAGTRYEHGSGIYGVLDWTYRSKSNVLPDDESIETPGYGLLGTRVGWHKLVNLGRACLEVDAAVGVKNLLDRDYYLQHNATQYVPGAPREVFVDLAVALQF